MIDPIPTVPDEEGVVEFTDQDVNYLLRLVRRDRTYIVRRVEKLRRDRENGVRPKLPPGKKDWDEADSLRAKLPHIDRLIERLENM